MGFQKAWILGTLGHPNGGTLSSRSCGFLLLLAMTMQRLWASPHLHWLCLSLFLTLLSRMYIACCFLGFLNLIYVSMKLHFLLINTCVHWLQICCLFSWGLLYLLSLKGFCFIHLLDLVVAWNCFIALFYLLNGVVSFLLFNWNLACTKQFHFV